jgi:hypothetical protein
MAKLERPIMLPPDRAQSFLSAPMEELLSVLLRQLKRPLGIHGLNLNDAAANRLAAARAAGDRPAETDPLLASLQEVVAESRVVLAGYGLTFQQSLVTEMNDVPGWETTAEFLEIANEKTNAELRITLGLALGVVYGMPVTDAVDLRFLARGDFGDEAVIARRALCFVAGVDPYAAEWLAQIEAWWPGG